MRVPLNSVSALPPRKPDDAAIVAPQQRVVGCVVPVTRLSTTSSSIVPVVVSTVVASGADWDPVINASAPWCAFGGQEAAANTAQ